MKKPWGTAKDWREEEIRRIEKKLEYMGRHKAALEEELVRLREPASSLKELAAPGLFDDYPEFEDDLNELRGHKKESESK